MNTVEEFIENLVKIEYVENMGSYGHYPFSLAAVTNNDQLEINALFLSGDVIAVYTRVREYVWKKAKRIYLAVDFPGVPGIQTDFVAVTAIENGKITSNFAIPYDPVYGTIYERITEAPFLQTLESQFNTCVFSQPGNTIFK